MLIFLIVAGAAAFMYTQMQREFLPAEDQGVLMAQVQLAPGATMQRTRKAVARVDSYFKTQPDVASVLAISGFSFSGNGQNAGIAFTKLKPWRQRSGPTNSASAIARRGTRALSSIRDARVYVVNPPTIRGLGNSSGFDMELENVGGISQDKFEAARDQFLKLAASDNKLAQVRAKGQAATQLKVNINDAEASALNLNLAKVYSTLSAAFGGTYIDDFVHGGRIKKVYMQAAAPYRILPGDISDWSVRNADGQMVPISRVCQHQLDA